MTKQAGESAKISPVKENVVEGVLRNYLDQLLVTATSPQKIEKSILISGDDESNQPVEINEAPIIAAAEMSVEVDSAHVELIRVDSVIPEAVIEEVAEEEQIIPAPDDQGLILENEVVIDQPLSPLTDQESWSSQGVECLVFSVGGLKLAVPLLFLGGVHEVDASDVKPLIGQPAWYLGMVHKNEENLQVIDTASFIMPERTLSLSEQGYKYLIQLEKTPWTIACQSIDDTVRLEANEIKWRGDRGKRAWLAGTVIEKMCALIDVSGLLQQVESSCKPV